MTQADGIAARLAGAAAATLLRHEIGPLDLWNAHHDGNGPGWTLRLDLDLPPGAEPEGALEALDRLGACRWSTEIRRSDGSGDGTLLRLVCALRACDWPDLLASTGAHLSAHLRAEIAAGGLRHPRR